MENINSNQQENVEKKKISLKIKAIIASVFVLILFLAYGYYWYASTKNLRIEAQTIIQKVEMYEKLSTKIQDERSRCENFITQLEGDFGSFEYCKKFIEWSNKK